MKFQSGFTLIELLVVISIIGLLSSIVIASVNSARLKGRDAAIRQEMVQFRTLIELDYSETGHYGNLQKSQWAPNMSCDSIPYVGNYVAQARTLCKSIIAKTGTSEVTGYPQSSPLYSFFSGNKWIEASGDVSRFSIMAWLPGKKKWFCIGSKGISDIHYTPASVPQWNEVGCYDDP